MNPITAYSESSVARIADGLEHEFRDVLAVEEPLEIRLGYLANGKRIHKPVSITMRTPGDDHELAAGFLFTEGILHSPDQIEKINHCGPKSAPGAVATGFLTIADQGAQIESRRPSNTIRVELADGVEVDIKRLERNFYTTSSCGICGKSSIEALQTGAEKLKTEGPVIPASLIRSLPEKLLQAQSVFEKTGGLHASGLFDTTGELRALREDVGRHNALDKVIGAKFLNNQVPLSDAILLVSGRASFELVQKALVAGIPIMAAVGAPSSLAVQLASEFGMTLAGFVREGGFNIYTGRHRIDLSR